MLQALLVTFREGLEALLIVGVISAYLRKTGRAGLLRGVRVGLAVSVVTCLGGAYLWQLVPNQPLYEGIAALTAAVLVGALLTQMVRMGRRLKGDIEARVERMAGDGTRAASLGAVAGVALVTVALVTREGLEAVLYLGIQARMAGDRASSLIGAALGLVAAAAVAWVWSRRALGLNLGVVLKVTAIFLSLFLFQLLIYGVHELAESGVIEGSQGFHDATEIAGPDGAIGHLISYSLLAAPLLYLLMTRRAAGQRRVRESARPQP
jgi:high-affinity iron transporter